MPLKLTKAFVVLIVFTMAIVSAVELDSLLGATAYFQNAQKQKKKDDSLLLIEPKTPEEIFDAALLMRKLIRPNLAKRYLQKFLDGKPSETLLLKLRDRHGPALFLNLALDKSLQPLSKTLLDRVNAAFQKQAADPVRTDRLLSTIADTKSSQVQKNAALSAIRSAGWVILPRIVQQLGNIEKRNTQASLVETLAYIGKPAVPALLGALRSPNVSTRTTVIEALGEIGDPSTIPYLWYHAFADDIADGERSAARRSLAKLYNVKENVVNNTKPPGLAKELRRIALVHYRNEFHWQKSDLDANKVELWIWDAANKTIARSDMTPEGASLYVGTILSEQAMELAPLRKEGQSLFLGMALASSAHRVGWNRPLPTGKGTAHDLALTSGPEVVDEALIFALKVGNSRASTAAMQVLAQIGSKQDIFGRRGKKAPMLSALNYPDFRVQFAAATAILQLDPSVKFTGTTRVVSILSKALTSSTESTSVVVNANPQKAGVVASHLNGMGYKTHVALTGREAFRTAAERGDVDLIALQINTLRWPLSQTVSNLKADARTASIPIAIYGPDNMKHDVDGLIDRYSDMVYVSESLTSDFFEHQLRPFLVSIKPPPFTEQQKIEFQKAAAFWLFYIANGKRTSIYNLQGAEDALIAASQNPELAGDVLPVLAVIPSAKSQIQLKTVALNTSLDVKIREQAALQLAFHIQHFGSLLRKSQVAEVETAWKAETNSEVATAIASVLGSLKPTHDKTFQRLKSFRPPLPETSGK